MFRCNCGRYSNFGTLCSYCSKDIETIRPQKEEIDLFYLVDKQDWDELRRLEESFNLSTTYSSTTR